MNRLYSNVAGLTVMVVLGAMLCGCPGVVPPDDGPPAAFTDADAVNGGTMYDKWWAVAGVDAPTEDHALWAGRPDTESNTRGGADTWRCKECHGWDYKGVDGAYSDGSHLTGIAGIYGTTMTAQEVFDLLHDDHGFHDAGLADADMWDLAKFVLEGQVDTATVIDADGAFNGDAANGQTLYDDGIEGNMACSGCHGADGLTAPPGAHDDYGDWVGKIANANAPEFLHKVRFGQPGTAMPASESVEAALSDAVDLATYAQTLPETAE